MRNYFVLLLLLFNGLSYSQALQCYSGSQLAIMECPSMSCIKQTLGYDTIRYCDGTGVSSICQTYRIYESCETIPNLGFICCCSGNLCNSSHQRLPFIATIIPLAFVVYRFLF